MVVLVGWLGLALAAAVIAGNKGRNGFGWFLIGLCLPLIGLIMALVISTPAVPPIDEDFPFDGPAKKCPDCIELVPAEARVCSHCGYRFDGSEPLADPRPYAPNIDISRWSKRDREKFFADYQPRPQRAPTRNR